MKAAAVAAKLEIPVTDSLKKILSWFLSVWLQYDDFLFLSALAEERLSLTAKLVAMVVVRLRTPEVLGSIPLSSKLFYDNQPIKKLLGVPARSEKNGE